jgi:hypothetical protein
MGFFRRGKADSAAGDQEVLAGLLFQGEGMIEQLAEAHRPWGLGSADRWDLDQCTGTISWTFPDKVASAPAQILGSYNPAARSWLWAWGNKTVLPDMSRDSVVVRNWGIEHGVDVLSQPKTTADDETAAGLAALAVRITRATGFYRGTGSASFPVITFGPVTLTARDGSTSTFAIDVAEE